MTNARFKHCQPSQMDQEAFIYYFSEVYEHSPWVAEKAYLEGLTQKHDEISELHQLMANIMLSATESEQLELIRAHPDLAGKAAVAGELTQASTDEQSSAGIHLCTPEEFREFNDLNNQYKSRFNFPFIMAVKGSDRFKILSAFRERIQNSYADEFNRALLEINKIALFRLQEM